MKKTAFVLACSILIVFGLTWLRNAFSEAFLQPNNCAQNPLIAANCRQDPSILGWVTLGTTYLFIVVAIAMAITIGWLAVAKVLDDRKL